MLDMLQSNTKEQTIENELDFDTKGTRKLYKTLHLRYKSKKHLRCKSKNH